MSQVSRRSWLACIAALTLMVEGCGDGATAPTPPKLANAAATAAQLQSVAASTETSALQSFELLAFYFVPAAVPAPTGPVWQPAPATTATDVAPLVAVLRVPAALTLRRALAGLSSGAAIFPDSVRGKTFVWDTTSRGYVPSSESGAPANGVRFLLYAIGLPLGGPSLPLTVIGYVDLTDRSDATATVLGITIVGTAGPTPVTYADYTLSIPSGSSALGVTLAGVLSDGTDRLDLTSDLSATLSAFTARTTVDLAPPGVHISQNASVSGAASIAITSDLSITSAGETVRANGSITVDTTTANLGGGLDVTVDGRPFATITVKNAGLGFTGARGVVLTAADQAALRALFTASIDLFATVVVLSEPALVLPGFASPVSRKTS